MRSWLLLVLLVMPTGWLLSRTPRPDDPPAAPTPTRTLSLNGHRFTLPRGFTIELAVKPGLIQRPITVDFDERGRLHVADSSGSNAPVQQQLKDRTHRMVRLEDRDGDGIFDHATTFADKMMFPEGTLWHDGSLFVSAPPSIWKLTDRDGDGKADERVEWFRGKTLTGCANDLHGPYLGLDGRIYWTKGAFAEQTYQRPGKKDFVTRASHIFRARADGSDIEPVMTGGMDNPVDVVFLPNGERIFSTTFLQHPAGGKRDGLIHAVYGGVWGKDHSPVYGHPWTGPALMPVLSHMGPAAPSGLTRYRSATFGPEYRDNLFAVQFNLRKVSRHVLSPSGATFTSRDEDFLVSDNRDFHPTDVVEDADGSLLVVDTGGWYKLCCPTSQLDKPDILGAIYRIRRTGAAPVDDPRGLNLDWQRMDESGRSLTSLLDDPRPAVVARAMDLLGKRGSRGLPALAETLRQERSETAVRNAVWTSARIDAPEARVIARVGLRSRWESVQQASLHVVSLWRDRDALELTSALLRSPSHAVRRVAAEALGRMEDPRAIPSLLAALREPCDRYLEHSLIYALIEIGQRDSMVKALSDDATTVRRAALIVLDQMPEGKLLASQVTPALTAKDPALKEAAWWIAGRHPDWGGDLARFFADRLRSLPDDESARKELASQLGRFITHPAIQSLLAERLRDVKIRRDEMQLLGQVIAEAGLKKVPTGWGEALAERSRSGGGEQVRHVLRAIRSLPIPPDQAGPIRSNLLRMAEAKEHPVDVRLMALASVPGEWPVVSPACFSLILEKLDREQPITERALAVAALSRARLNREQMLALADALKTTGPMDLDRCLDRFTAGGDDALGKRLLASLRAAPSRSSLRTDSLKSRLAKFGPAVQTELQSLLRELDMDATRQKEELEKKLAELRGGDIRRGQAVFNSDKAGCAACHAIGYVGGKIGPDLTRIGGIRSERDLLEAVIFPSASLVRSYEPVLVSTTEGRLHNGLIQRDTPEEVVLTLSATEALRLPRNRIEEIQPSKVSVMPAGIDKVLTGQELADLVAFLRACR